MNFFNRNIIVGTDKYLYNISISENNYSRTPDANIVFASSVFILK